jgi:hypothetical protein
MGFWALHNPDGDLVRYFSGDTATLLLNLPDGWSAVDLPNGFPDPGTAPLPMTTDQLRALRDSLLDRTIWAVLDDSPLTNTSKHAFSNWRETLHRWLLDHPGVTPPDPPTPIFKP